MENKKHATAKKQLSDTPILSAYDALVEAGSIQDDAAQRALIPALETLRLRIDTPTSKLKKIFSREEPIAKQSIYIWGSVGRGKSMMMDVFFGAVQMQKKRRVHFHAFMQEVHARMHQLRTQGRQNSSGADPVIMLAREIAKETSLLCFDELQAHDVTDATLLYRLFDALWAQGVIVVSTSNHPPASLYTGGIQRERFAKFITLINEQMQVLSLASPSDYRYLQLRSLQHVYHTPLGKSAQDFVTSTIAHLGITDEPKPDILVVQGRTIPFMRYEDAIGLFSFAGLCEAALGAADYLAIARKLDTVILTNIPLLTPEKRNEAKRFVTLIDTLYEAKVKLIATAEAKPEALYVEGDGSFEFARTVSRLAEMQSENYLQGKRA